MSAQCFQIHSTDNVATLLEDADAGAEVEVRGGATPHSVRASHAIHTGHKIAILPLAQGAPVVKYGCTIGEATQAIAQGDWVHLHNCRSLYDERSSMLDVASGARKETRYA